MDIRTHLPAVGGTGRDAREPGAAHDAVGGALAALRQIRSEIQAATVAEAEAAIGRRLVPGLWWLTTGGAKTTAVPAARRLNRRSAARRAVAGRSRCMLATMSRLPDARRRRDRHAARELPRSHRPGRGAVASSCSRTAATSSTPTSTPRSRRACSSCACVWDLGGFKLSRAGDRRRRCGRWRRASISPGS